MLSDFDNQFQTIHSISGIEFVEIIPENPIGNPVVYCLGWTGTIEGCREYFKDFYDGGKTVLSIRYPTETPPFAQESIPEGFSSYGFQSALALLTVLKEKKLQVVDLVGHSEGGTIALMLNALLPTLDIKSENIILVNSAGFGTASPIEMYKRITNMLAQELQRTAKNPELFEKMSTVLSSGMKSFGTNPHSMAEGASVMDVDIQVLLSSLFRHGQHLAIIHANDDPVVKLQEVAWNVRNTQETIMQERVTETLERMPDLQNEPDVRDHVTNAVRELDAQEFTNPLVIFLPGGHLFHGLYPKTYVRIAVDLLNYFRTGILPKRQIANGE